VSFTASKPSISANERKIIFASEAASILNVSNSTVARLCEEGALVAWRVSVCGWWRIEYGSVIARRERAAKEVNASVAAGILGISRTDVLELCRKGSLRSRRLGECGAFRIERDSILKYQAAHSENSAGKEALRECVAVAPAFGSLVSRSGGDLNQDKAIDISVSAAARIAGCSGDTILRWIEEREKIEARRDAPRGWYKIDRSSLKRFLKSREAL
jgi:hypothetical protein